MKHTPTPWRIGIAPSQIMHDGIVIAQCYYAEGALNAARIVACVNAFEGVEDIDLKEIGRLLGERNELSQRLSSEVQHGRTRTAKLEELVLELIKEGLFVESDQRQYRRRLNTILGKEQEGEQ